MFTKVIKLLHGICLSLSTQLLKLEILCVGYRRNIYLYFATDLLTFTKVLQMVQKVTTRTHIFREMYLDLTFSPLTYKPMTHRYWMFLNLFEFTADSIYSESIVYAASKEILEQFLTKLNVSPWVWSKGVKKMAEWNYEALIVVIVPNARKTKRW